jgi:hypothetical protein
MKKKASIKSTELVDIFQARLGWNKARVKFFVSFIIALCKVQTVCFSRLAQGYPPYQPRLRLAGFYL